MHVNTEQLKIGIAGWSYTDWHDTVYRLPPAQQQVDLFGDPIREPAQYARDELVFIKDFVDMIEINSSFYRIPSPKATASWVRRVSDKPHFFFTAKLNNAFTHDQRRDPTLAKAFVSAMRPLAEAGRLRGLLAQFRYDFSDTPAAREVLSWIRSQFSPLAPLIVEVRHVSWQTAEALGFLQDLPATVAHLDYPTARDSFTPRLCTSGQTAYLRLHGRNRKAWFSRKATVEETYNYDYSTEEVKGLAERSEEILGKVKELTIVANNHYQGKAVSAALRIKSELTKEKLAIPPALVDTYPHLIRILKQ
ncbi:MAG: DUF72 domain-containing protein [Lentisphaerae bacterium]|jgi:uncharacterized protein YecE (DUF72 family)|nr:DUF72 domain-containing protein [Lentisphaerota bacterium]MBT4820778.1 DUF72 domain-containing protein [Lentisphaerota bacterium]MBT5610563.1 DUF72 domain-containing protein [Lentisphaerota bacterium]MBT7060157.1 DUF72 domain-containing protein [Lentisphaerota bacterium]MBT7844122.1 DUF72 domain-containing protein [Lentisphaerota bacterium]